jgi:hypothetical protein
MPLHLVVAPISGYKTNLIEAMTIYVKKCESTTACKKKAF